MIRVVIADDHPVVRKGFRRVLEAAGDIQVVGEAGDGEQVLHQVADAKPDVLLLDVTMPGGSFLDTLGRVRTQHPSVRVLVASMHPEREYALRALTAGAAGYLSKERTPDEFVEAVRRVHKEGRYLTEEVATSLLSSVSVEHTLLPHERLSKREHAVLVALGAGRSLKQIAASLAISPKTVSTYRTRVLQKLGLTTTADLIRYVLEHGLGGERPRGPDGAARA
jgi:DNA-binding NarL/FixJ family response regulator